MKKCTLPVHLKASCFSSPRRHRMSHDLFDDHRAITAAADEILAALRHVPRRRMDEIVQMRARLAGLTAAHLRAEEDMLIQPLKAQRLIDQIPAAGGVIAGIREGRSIYSDHIRKWTPHAMEANWTGYVRATGEVVRLAKLLMLREEAELYRPGLALLAPAARAGRA